MVRDGLPGDTPQRRAKFELSPDRRRPNPLVPYLVSGCGRQKAQEINRYFRASASVFPRRAGEGETVIPAEVMAAIFDSASPLPPEMMAPA